MLAFQFLVNRKIIPSSPACSWFLSWFRSSLSCKSWSWCCRYWPCISGSCRSSSLSCRSWHSSCRFWPGFSWCGRSSSLSCRSWSWSWAWFCRSEYFISWSCRSSSLSCLGFAFLGLAGPRPCLVGLRPYLAALGFAGLVLGLGLRFGSVLGLCLQDLGQFDLVLRVKYLVTFLLFFLLVFFFTFLFLFFIFVFTFVFVFSFSVFFFFFLLLLFSS